MDHFDFSTPFHSSKSGLPLIYFPILVTQIYPILISPLLHSDLSLGVWVFQFYDLKVVCGQVQVLRSSFTSILGTRLDKQDTSPSVLLFFDIEC